MENAAGSESALCGFKSRSPYHFSDLMRSCRRASIPLGFQVLGSAGRNGGSRSTSRGFEPRNPNQLNAMNNPSDPSDPSDLPGAPAPAPQSPPTAKDYAWFRACLYADGSMLVAHGDGTLLIDEKAPYG